MDSGKNIPQGNNIGGNIQIPQDQTASGETPEPPTGDDETNIREDTSSDPSSGQTQIPPTIPDQIPNNTVLEQPNGETTTGNSNSGNMEDQT